MSDQPSLYNSVAPLANVAALRTLIERCASRAHGLPGMGCFYGPAGHGKTTSGIYAVNALNCVHIEALPFGGAKGLMGNIVKELNIRPARTLTGLFDQAAEELAVSGRPLIIDEADKVLSDTVIETVRRLHDVTGVPVILMGEEVLPQKLMRWERVHSRMLAWVATQPATMADVSQLAPIYASGVTIQPDLKDKVLKASRGSIRYVSTNLAAIREFAAARGLTQIGLAEWGTTGLHTGEAPAPRGRAVA